jgi:hypothetical protein
MVKLLPLLLILFISVTNSTLGQKGKKSGSSVKVFLPKTELLNYDLKSGETVSICSWSDLIDRIEITDNTPSYYQVTIKNTDNDEIILKSGEFRTSDIGGIKGKVVLKIYPWIYTFGSYSIKVTKESSMDHSMRNSGEVPENEPEEVINFIYSIEGCG